jgi:hypothetical protein
MLFPALAAIALSSVSPISSGYQTIDVDGQSITASVVRVKLSAVQMKVGLAQGLVGHTDTLENIAKRYGAIAGIDGSFFEAYDPGVIKNPNHTLITNGEVVHVGNVGTMIGFHPDGKAKIQRVQWTIRGSRSGSSAWPNNWFAYWLNRYPTNSTVTIFTPAWGTSTGMAVGTEVVVTFGVVTAITTGSVPIPRTGFVIYFKNAEQSLLKTFAVGQRVSYSVDQKGVQDGFWLNVSEGLGAGPLLVDHKEIVLNAVAEGFSSDKILTGSGDRSAVGLTDDGELLMVVMNGTVQQTARVMQGLGCVTALNLDGGASSSLWYQGRSLRTPGRLISNALLVLPKK